MAARRITPFQVVGTDGRNVLQFGPRYARLAYDDTTVISLFHRTTGGNVSVLLERYHFADFARWLAAGERIWHYEGLTHDGRFTRTEDGGMEVKIRWHSASGTSRSVILTPGAVADLLVWVADKDTNGWEGWKSGRTGAQ
jgi:hypothetical protein